MTPAVMDLVAYGGSCPIVSSEVKSGCYLGEDDIVRFSDNYNRVREAG